MTCIIFFFLLGGFPLNEKKKTTELVCSEITMVPLYKILVYTMKLKYTI